MNLRLHRRFEAEIRDAAIWYRSQDIGLQQRFLEVVRSAFERLENDPHQFAKLETASKQDPFRRVLIDEFPYVIVYEVIKNEIFVYAVAHASRRPNYWRRRKRKQP